MKDETGKRLVFGDFVDKLFWVLLMVIGTWAGSQIKDLSRNVQDLNTTMIVIGSEVKNTRVEVDKTNARQDRLEERVRQIELRRVGK